MRGLPIWILSLCLGNSLLAAAAAAPAANAPAPLPDVHRSGFVYCVNGILNTFNPQMAAAA
ncbi:antimicrobial peptide ABC transporter periplasmic binding protein SapA [Serratia rubidaea]|uniref:Antimicrobial peptide ABC transporter periplasmic binding protein SapA n=1 Tax=Serratia rubidaea TaxID=61652 RepID=A0A4U9HFK1_SERRU|nr:antimicrobial peptide ABC transporter periplasmic binding protein SapA [Serratia rubidaea]